MPKGSDIDGVIDALRAVADGHAPDAWRHSAA